MKKVRIKRYLKWIIVGLSLLFSISLLAANSAKVQNDVKSDLSFLSDEEQAAEIARRNAIQELQNKGINANLYQQGLPPISTESGEVDPMQIIIASHFGGFCDRAAENEGGNNYSCQDDLLLAHGDIKLSTLLSSAKFNEDQLKAVKQFVQNIIDPFPTDKLHEKSSINAEALKDPAKRKEISRELIDEANRSVARQSFAEMISKRMSAGNVPSVMQKMEKEAYRYSDPKWQETLKKGYELALKQNPAMAVLYDIAIMDAYRDWLEFERYKQGERIESLLAAQLIQFGEQARYSKGVVTEGQKTPALSEEQAKEAQSKGVVKGGQKVPSGYEPHPSELPPQQ